MQRPDRRGEIETLADLPGLFLVAHRPLQITPGHVQTDGIGVDMVQRRGHRDISTTPIERRDQFNLVVVIAGQGRIRVIRNRAGRDILNRISGLLKKEGRLTRGIGAHLARMRGVITTDAVNTAHRKHLIGADDRNIGRRHCERRLDPGLRNARQGATCQRPQAKGGALFKQRSAIHQKPPIIKKFNDLYNNLDDLL